MMNNPSAFNFNRIRILSNRLQTATRLFLCISQITSIIHLLIKCFRIFKIHFKCSVILRYQKFSWKVEIKWLNSFLRFQCNVIELLMNSMYKCFEQVYKKKSMKKGIHGEKHVTLSSKITVKQAAADSGASEDEDAFGCDGDLSDEFSSSENNSVISGMICLFIVKVIILFIFFQFFWFFKNKFLLQNLKANFQTTS